MSDINNLADSDAVEKIKELAMSENICLFATNLEARPIAVRPMSSAGVDDDGNLWFFSALSSDKNKDIRRNSEVQLFYANKGSAEFLSVYGNAFVVADKNKAEQLWTPLAKTWFPGGVDDPELTLIRVAPLDAYYWDTRNGKIVSLLKIITGAITGKTMDDGVQGKLQPR
jgi:general stress protein 26